MCTLEPTEAVAPLTRRNAMPSAEAVLEIGLALLALLLLTVMAA